MLHFPGYFLSSRQTLENLFARFERTYIGVVFDTKISAGNHYVFAGERLKKLQKFDFSQDAFLDTRSEGLVTSYESLIVIFVPSPQVGQVMTILTL